MTRFLWPRSDDVARAIIAAAQEMGVDPELVRNSPGQGYPGREASRIDRNRARTYAALALRTIWNDKTVPGGPGNVSFSRMVGGNPNLLARYDSEWPLGQAYWFKTDILERIIKAVLSTSESDTSTSRPEAVAKSAAHLETPATTMVSAQVPARHRRGAGPSRVSTPPPPFPTPRGAPLAAAVRTPSLPTPAPLKAPTPSPSPVVDLPRFLPRVRSATLTRAAVLVPVPKALPARRVPVRGAASATAQLMGDPPPARSALAEYVEREKARQEKQRLDQERYG